MPAGLDGNPRPLRSVDRDAVIDGVVDQVLARQRSRGGRVVLAIDGQSGVGKSTFADEVASRLAPLGAEVIRSTTDSFHRPRAERLRRGPTSAEGFYLDSHQLDCLRSELLEPFRSGAPEVRTATFDEPTDTETIETTAAGPGAILVFDGLFLQRSELRMFWDLSVLLVADHRRDQEWLDFLLSDLPTDPSAAASALDQRLQRARWPRYRDGWRHYRETDEPADAADVVIDNNDLAAPIVTKR